MKCISKLITLLVSASLAAQAAGECALIDGARILASDLAPFAPAFATLPADKDIGPAPAGTMVRVFSKVQLADLLADAEAQVPDRLCVQRKRDPIPAEAWQAAVDAAMTRLCPDTPWKAKVLEAPNHRFPSGSIQLGRSGIVAGHGSVQLWRGSLLLPDKSSIPIWVRLEIRTQRMAAVLQRPLTAGQPLTEDDYRVEEVWAPGLCDAGPARPSLDGFVTKRAMQSGSEVLLEHLRRAPAVHRGQSVDLEVTAGRTRLRVPAVASHDAEVGEAVKLKSTWNGSLLMGRVTGSQKAKVD